MYLKRVAEDSASDSDSTAQVAAQEEPELDEFERMKNEVTRYYKAVNPTRKCLNCKEFGHMAYECPNERRRLNCILCGKDTHDSFECDEKLCFKCNQVGHKASECISKDVVKCVFCGMLGHLQHRCLKVWASSDTHRLFKKELKRCMECSRFCHFRCTSYKESQQVKLTFRVQNNLDEFLVLPTKDDSDSSEHNSSLRKRHQKHKQKQKFRRDRVLSNQFLNMQTTSDEESCESDSDSNSTQSEVQCPACAGAHDIGECYSKRGNAKYFHYENLRNRFAKDVKPNDTRKRTEQFFQQITQQQRKDKYSSNSKHNIMFEP